MGATGLISPLVESMRTLIAASSTFQTWVGAEDATEALASVHVEGIDEADIADPCVIVFLSRWQGQAIAGGANYEFGHDGHIDIVFRGTVPSESATTHEAAVEWITNAAGGAISDMEAIAGSGTYLMALGFQYIPGTLWRADRREKAQHGDIIEMVFRCPWGLSHG